MELNRLEAAVFEKIQKGMSIPDAMRSLGYNQTWLTNRVRTSLVGHGLIKVMGRGDYKIFKKPYKVNRHMSIYTTRRKGRKGNRETDLDLLLQTRGPAIEETVKLRKPEELPQDVLDYIKAHVKAGRRRTFILEAVNKSADDYGYEKLTKVQLNHIIDVMGWGRD